MYYEATKTKVIIIHINAVLLTALAAEDRHSRHVWLWFRAWILFVGVKQAAKHQRWAAFWFRPTWAEQFTLIRLNVRAAF